VEAPTAESSNRASVHPPKPQERNDVVGLVISALLTVAGAGLTGFFSDKV
jgi:hypothetical protein